MLHNNKVPAGTTAETKSEKLYNYTIPKLKSKINVNLLDMIPQGKENRITATELVERADYRHTREVTLEIAKLRKDHAIIALPDQVGYWRPLSEEINDVKHFIASMESRAKSDLLAVRGAKLWLHDHGEEIDDV